MKRGILQNKNSQVFDSILSIKKILIVIAIVSFSSCDVFEEYEEWDNRAAQITMNCSTNYEKAKAIFIWECENIEYDCSYSIYDYSQCWNERRGVCQAYSELFVVLARHCGLNAELIRGNCRTLVVCKG